MTNITEMIDRQMQAQKMIVCKGFSDDDYFHENGDYRAVIPVLDEKGDSFPIPLEMMILCRSGGSLDEFNLVLLASLGEGKRARKGICRLDFGQCQMHVLNPKHDAPQGWDWQQFPDMRIKGTHIHSWRLNMHLGTERRLPKLPFALPLDVDAWDDAFDAFCQECIIQYDVRPHCRRALL